MNAFAALADPTRQQIVRLLAPQPLSAGQIGAHFKVSAPAISQHLKILRGAELVSVRVEGQHRIYSLNSQGLEPISEFIEQIRRFWAPRLDALEQQLTREVDDE